MVTLSANFAITDSESRLVSVIAPEINTGGYNRSDIHRPSVTLVIKNEARTQKNGEGEDGDVVISIGSCMP